jgi:hypothetical protein
VNAVKRLGLAAAVCVLVAGAFLTPRLLTCSHRQVSQAVVSDRALVADVREAGDEPDDSDGANGFVDLYGNEVTDAIATYTLDQAGSLYELHSPQTQLPRLGIPKS